MRKEETGADADHEGRWVQNRHSWQWCEDALRDKRNLIEGGVSHGQPGCRVDKKKVKRTGPLVRGEISTRVNEGSQGSCGRYLKLDRVNAHLHPRLGSFHNVPHAENWVSYSYSCICMRCCQGKVSKLGERKTSTLHEALLMVRVIEQLLSVK